MGFAGLSVFAYMMKSAAPAQLPPLDRGNALYGAMQFPQYGV
jgi:hypothetical protein